MIDASRGYPGRGPVHTMSLRRHWVVLTAGVICALAIAFLWLAWTGHFRFRDSVAPAPSTDWLRKRVSVTIEDQPLDKVLAQLARTHNVRLTIDTDLLAESGLTGQEQVSLQLRDVTVAAVLHHLPRTSSAQFAVLATPEGIRLTTAEHLWNEQALETRVHPLTDLMASPFGFDHRTIGELVQSLVYPDTWYEVGGLGFIEAVPGALVVSNTEGVHREIQDLLRQLAKTNRPGFQSISLDDEDAERREIERRLSQTVSIEFWEASLGHALEWIGNEHNLPILIDERALANIGVSPTDQLTLRVESVTLKSALWTILHEFELGYYVSHGVIVVTTPEGCGDFLADRVYPIQDLLLWLEDDSASLLEVIRDFVTADTWDHYGGPGSLVRYGGCLVVSQNPEVHRELESFLQRLRREIFPYVSHASPPPEGSDATDTPIYEVLQQQTTIELERVALRYFVRRIADDYAINVRLDEHVLLPLGLSPDHIISTEQRDLPLGEAIRRTLEELELAPVVVDGVLWVTSEDVAEAALETRFYSIGDLIYLDRAHEPAELAELIPSIAGPVESWEDYGGPGQCNAMNDLLVINSTKEVHREVGAFLAGLREWQQAGEPAEFQFRVDDGDSIVRMYDMRTFWQSMVDRLCQQARAAKPWYELPYEYRVRRSDGFAEQTFARGMMYHLADHIREAMYVLQPNTRSQIGFFQGTLVVRANAAGHDETRRAVQQLLTRQTGETEDNAFRIYDLTDLLDMYPNLDAELVQQMVEDVVHPSRWHASEGSLDGSRIVLPELLLLWHDVDGHQEIERLLARLLELDQPGLFRHLPDTNQHDPQRSIALKPPTVAMLLSDMRTTDRVKRDLAVWLLGRDTAPGDEVIGSIVEQLGEAVDSDDVDLQVLSLSILLRHDDKITAALPQLKTILSRPASQRTRECRTLAIQGLWKSADKSIPLLQELLRREDTFEVQEIAAILMGFKEVAQPLLSDVLVRCDLKQLGQLEDALFTVDPQGVRIREVLAGWHSSNNESLQRRAKIIGDEFRNRIGGWDL